MSENHHYEHPKIELLPPALILLRKEIFTHWPTLWGIVGGMLIHDHEHLLEYMNAACDVHVTPFTHSLEDGCSIWLGRLQDMRRAAGAGIILPNGNGNSNGSIH